MKSNRQSLSILLRLLYLVLAFPGVSASLMFTVFFSLHQRELVLNPLILFVVSLVIVNFVVPRALRKILKSIPRSWRKALREIWKLIDVKTSARVSGGTDLRTSLRESTKIRSFKKD